MDNIEQFDQFFKYSHYDIIRLALSISGLWPFHTFRRRCVMYIAMILVLGSGFLFEIFGLMKIWHDTLQVMDTMPILLFAVATIIKVTYAVHTLSKLKLLLINIQEYCLSSKLDEETKIYNSHGLYGRKFGFIYMILLVSHSIVYQFTILLVKLINTSKEKDTSLNKTQVIQSGITYPVNYMIDIDTYYFPIFIHTAICEVFYAFLIATCDILYVSLVEYCCGLFESLRYRLEHAYDFENNNDGLILTQNVSYSNIVYSIQRHTQTMQFIAIMESMYNFPFFVHVGITIINLSIVGFQIITNMGNINNVIKHTSYLNALIINIFFQNWQGQKIIDASEKVFESAYNTKWYNMSIVTRKLLIMIMMLSKKPLNLTIGKLSGLSYITFNAIIRTSSSYFMLLRSLQ